MRRALLTLPILLAACASRPALPSETMVPPPASKADPSQARDQQVLALIDGHPVTWRQVADHAMTLNGRQLTDQYIAWSLRQEVIRSLSLSNTTEELRARARTLVEQARQSQGDERLQTVLRERGLTETEYVERFVADPLFGERLLAEKAVTITLLTEASAEVDIVTFANEQDATDFVAQIQAGTPFAQAARSEKTRGRVTAWPRRRIVRGFLPSTMAHIEEKVLSMKAGETTGVERTLTQVAFVAHVVASTPASIAPPARERVMEEILRAPPGDDEIKMWTDRLFRRSKIFYEDARD
ncbi:MAG: hypothetical protein HYY16_00880 [Planctomycetes bacterium]|nr:hypothetical protein [Planctomycetota bacterium]